MIADAINLVGDVIHAVRLVLDQSNDRMLLRFDAIRTLEFFIGLQSGSFPFKTNQQQTNYSLRNGSVLRWARKKKGWRLSECYGVKVETDIRENEKVNLFRVNWSQHAMISVAWRDQKANRMCAI